MISFPLGRSLCASRPWSHIVASRTELLRLNWRPSSGVALYRFKLGRGEKHSKRNENGTKTASTIASNLSIQSKDLFKSKLTAGRGPPAGTLCDSLLPPCKLLCGSIISFSQCGRSNFRGPISLLLAVRIITMFRSIRYRSSPVICPSLR